jgi:hypothetical protein
MIVITVRVEPDEGEIAAPGANVLVTNPQNGAKCSASLPSGDSMEYRLQLKALGKIEISVYGWPRA